MKKTFKCKINDEDKVIGILYHLLKMNDFPIIIDNLLSYSRMSKSKVLIIYRNKFNFVEQSEKYIMAIYERGVKYLNSIGIESTITAKVFF